MKPTATTNQPDAAIAVENLTKRYGDTVALDGISFRVQRNELFGIIGPDGGGKTTLFRILTSLLRPGSGRARTYGLDVVTDYKRIRQIIGYMPGRFSLYQDLTVEENLAFFASIFGADVNQNYDLIAPIYDHIKPFAKRRAGDLSGGMKQKLALSCALIHRPKILFLDEPTTGIDAVSRTELWQMLRSLGPKGVTVVVSTPYMDEALLCDRVLLLQDGRILDTDTPEAIIAHFDKHLIAVETEDNKRALRDLRDLDPAFNVQTFGYEIHVSSERALERADIEKFLRGRGYRRVRVDDIVPTIEDCFIELMQKEKEHVS